MPGCCSTRNGPLHAVVGKRLSVVSDGYIRMASGLDSPASWPIEWWIAKSRALRCDSLQRMVPARMWQTLTFPRMRLKGVLHVSPRGFTLKTSSHFSRWKNTNSCTFLASVHSRREIQSINFMSVLFALLHTRKRIFPFLSLIFHGNLGLHKRTLPINCHQADWYYYVPVLRPVSHFCCPLYYGYNFIIDNNCTQI